MGKKRKLVFNTQEKLAEKLRRYEGFSFMRIQRGEPDRKGDHRRDHEVRDSNIHTSP